MSNITHIILLFGGAFGSFALCVYLTRRWWRNLFFVWRARASLNGTSLPPHLLIAGSQYLMILAGLFAIRKSQLGESRESIVKLVNELFNENYASNAQSILNMSVEDQNIMKEAMINHIAELSDQDLGNIAQFFLETSRSHTVLFSLDECILFFVSERKVARKNPIMMADHAERFFKWFASQKSDAPETIVKSPEKE